MVVASGLPPPPPVALELEETPSGAPPVPAVDTMLLDPSNPPPTLAELHANAPPALSLPPKLDDDDTLDVSSLDTDPMSSDRAPHPHASMQTGSRAIAAFIVRFSLSGP